MVQQRSPETQGQWTTILKIQTLMQKNWVANSKTQMSHRFLTRQYWRSTQYNLFFCAYMMLNNMYIHSVNQFFIFFLLKYYKCVKVLDIKCNSSIYVIQLNILTIFCLLSKLFKDLSCFKHRDNVIRALTFNHQSNLFILGLKL